MTIDLPVIPSPQATKRKRKKLDSSIPKWTVFFLCIVTILVVVSITNTIIPLLFVGLILAFIWSQATKPVAHFERDMQPNGKQLDLFYQNQIINKHSIEKMKDKKERRAA